MRLYYPLVSESGLPGGGQDDTSFFSWRAIFHAGRLADPWHCATIPLHLSRGVHFSAWW